MYVWRIFCVEWREGVWFRIEIVCMCGEEGNGECKRTESVLGVCWEGQNREVKWFCHLLLFKIKYLY